MNTTLPKVTVTVPPPILPPATVTIELSAEDASKVLALLGRCKHREIEGLYEQLSKLRREGVIPAFRIPSELSDAIPPIKFEPGFPF